jgi:hypothetical protein
MALARQLARSPRSVFLPLAVLVVALDFLLAARLVDHGPAGAAALSLLPAVVVGLGALVASNREILVYAALGLSMTAAPLTGPLPLVPGLYAADVIAMLALSSWVFARLLGGDKAGGPRAAAVGWPFALFAVAVLQAVLRGHEHYGLDLVSQPLRLVLYASMALAVTDCDPRRLYRGVVAVFYIGTGWMLLNAAYHVATGTSQTDQVNVSTGGTRYVSLSVAMYLASALFLALLNLQIDNSARRRLLHASVAALAAFGVILALGRTTFLAVGVVVPLLVVAAPRVRNAILGLLPLCLPFLVLAALLVPRFVPDVGPQLVHRITASPASDVNARWRVAAAAAVWRQVEESPLVGVGFGRDESFVFDEKVRGITIPRRQTVGQDPHNGFLYLLAGGGAFALGAFFLVLLRSLQQAWQALRAASEPRERVLVVWSGLALFAFLVNAVSGLQLQSPSTLITIWALLVLPSALIPRSQGAGVARFALRVASERV